MIGEGTNSPSIHLSMWALDDDTTVSFRTTISNGSTGYEISFETEETLKYKFANPNVIDLPVDDKITEVDITSEYIGATYNTIKNHFANGVEGVLYSISYDSNSVVGESDHSGIQYAYLWENSNLEMICAYFDDRNCTSVICTSNK